MSDRGGDPHLDGAVFFVALLFAWIFESGTVFLCVMAFLPVKILLRHILEK
jgi:hypothetical protein